MKPKQYKVLHWLNTGIFPATIMFSCGFNYDEVVKQLKNKKAHDWLTSFEFKRDFFKTTEFGAASITLENPKTKQEKKYLIIYIKDCFDFKDISYCSLAHECLHICQYILPEFLDRNKEHEAETYLHSHIMSQCLEILRGKK